MNADWTETWGHFTLHKTDWTCINQYDTGNVFIIETSTLLPGQCINSEASVPKSSLSGSSMVVPGKASWFWDACLFPCGHGVPDWHIIIQRWIPFGCSEVDMGQKGALWESLNQLWLFKGFWEQLVVNESGGCQGNSNMLFLAGQLSFRSKRGYEMAAASRMKSSPFPVLLTVLRLF